MRNDPAWQAEQLANWRGGAPSVYDQAVPSLGYVTLSQLVGDAKAAELLADVQAYVATQTESVYYPIMQAQLDLLADDTVGQMELIAIDGFYAASGAPEAGKEYITYLAANQHALSRGACIQSVVFGLGR